MKKLKQAHGNWVAGERFWDREDELALFIERIEEGAHQLMVAPRRMGKTSFMQETARRLEDRYICLFVDLQKAHAAADAVVELSAAAHPHRDLWGKIKGVFSSIFETVAHTIDGVELGELKLTLRAGITKGDWAQKGDQLMNILAASEQPVPLLLDEVPIMVNRLLKGYDYSITSERRREADEFMSWLRENSVRHQGAVRMALSGSIGFEPILRQAHLSSTLNPFDPFKLDPWPEATAVGCLDALAAEYGVQFQDGVPAEMVRRLGCNIPHHVQMFFGHVYATCKKRKCMEFSIEDVDSVYETEMYGTRGHAELTHYEERLKLVLGEKLFSLALELLTEAAVTGRLTAQACNALKEDYSFEGQTVAEAEKEVLLVLEHDGYLVRRPDGYGFVSSLVRDWWKARHSFGFTPIIERGV